MNVEVEQKYRVDEPDEVRERLQRLGAEFGDPVRQIDAYYNHPSRDFAETDEALRLRRVGERTFITYKGPKLDRTVKTRLELEAPLAEGLANAEQYGRVLEALGFRPTAVVAKSRATAKLTWGGTEYEAAWDEVDRLGTFLEIELLVDEAERDHAQRKILALEKELELSAVERRSYLEMVLALKA